MGRTSKFTFPVPGRKPKPSALTDISPPLSKAQKILGSGGINIDSPTIAKDPTRIWEAASASGISVCVSESTASHASDIGLGILDEDEVSNGARKGVRWDQESDVIPARERLRSRGGDSMTEVSSIRRRESSSTITSFYDKSKLPLSISQQTSNSAMAKGLPQKASALLDMDGTRGSTNNTQKKRPARLDLSYLLPMGRRKRQSELPKELALRPDPVTQKPSLSSMSSEAALRKKNTQESLRSLQHYPRQDVLSPPLTAVGLPRGKRSGVDLNTLYEHYEQRTFQDIMDGQEPGQMPTRAAQPFPTPPLSATRRAEPAPSSAALARRPPGASQSHLRADEPSTPKVAVIHSIDRPSPPQDSSASICSNRTRASRRSDRAMAEANLLQSSVLSLSSDSEGDDEADSTDPRPRTSISMPEKIGPAFFDDDSLSPMSPVRHAGHRSSLAADTGKTKRPSKQPSSDAVRGNIKAARTATKVSPAHAVQPPVIAARTSSLSLRSASTVVKAPTLSSRSTSRNSLLSDITSNSMGTLPRHARTALRPPHQAKTITMIPAVQNRTVYSPHRSSSRHSRSSEQPTPPLSPTSVDFLLNSQHTSILDADIGSIRSGCSLPTISESHMLSSSSLGRAPSTRSATSALSGHDSNRIMAVTPQEEMLLAAMRMKRARMRETIIAEFEEEQERVFEDILQSGSSGSDSDSGGNSQLPQQGQGWHSRSSSVIDMADEDTAATFAAARAAQHSRQSSYGSTVIQGFRRVGSQGTLGSVAELTEEPHSRRQSATPSMTVNTSIANAATSQRTNPTPTSFHLPLSSRSLPSPALVLPLSAHSTTATAQSSSSPRSPANTGSPGRAARNHIALCLDRLSPSPVTSITEASEPSPDLSDFMVFDNGSEEFPFQTLSSDDGRQGSASSSSGGGDGRAARHHRRGGSGTNAEDDAVSPRSSAAAGRLLNPGREQRRHQHPGPYRRGGGDAAEPASPRSVSGISNGSLSWHHGGHHHKDAVRVRIVEDENLVGVDGDEGEGMGLGLHDGGEVLEEDQGIPRPDSPIASIVPVMPRKKAARLSAVGGVGVGGEVEWWVPEG